VFDMEPPLPSDHPILKILKAANTVLARVDSLNANYSFKYFGKDQGTMERQICRLNRVHKKRSGVATYARTFAKSLRASISG
jgi:hypothetical protein